MNINSNLAKESRELAIKHNKYKCWDCEKEVFGVNLTEEQKKTCLVTLNPPGYFLIVCKECGKREGKK